ncbi:MAG: 50S ribosomal protein L9 [Anaerolineales bacterium]|nr:50S ribosomal protein L9 [Anaerolineales bacterium]
MDVLLLEDVYKLGRAGQVKKVANGFGRNFLIPQGLAVPATKGAVKMAERISAEAGKRRDQLNTEMKVVAERFAGLQLFFPARAGETGKLYGSVTTQMMADQLNEKLGLMLDKRQINTDPLRLLGLHKAAVRLTVDIIPEFEVIVYREGENPENYMMAAEELAAASGGGGPQVAAVVEEIEEAAEAVAEVVVEPEAEASEELDAHTAGEDADAEGN